MRRAHGGEAPRPAGLPRLHALPRLQDDDVAAGGRAAGVGPEGTSGIDRRDLPQMERLAQTHADYRAFLAASVEENWVRPEPEDLLQFTPTYQ